MGDHIKSPFESSDGKVGNQTTIHKKNTNYPQVAKVVLVEGGGSWWSWKPHASAGLEGGSRGLHMSSATTSFSLSSSPLTLGGEIIRSSWENDPLGSELATGQPEATGAEGGTTTDKPESHCGEAE